MHQRTDDLLHLALLEALDALEEMHASVRLAASLARGTSQAALAQALDDLALEVARGLGRLHGATPEGRPRLGGSVPLAEKEARRAYP